MYGQSQSNIQVKAMSLHNFSELYEVVCAL